MICKIETCKKELQNFLFLQLKFSGVFVCFGVSSLFELPQKLVTEKFFFIPTPDFLTNTHHISQILIPVFLMLLHSAAPSSTWGHKNKKFVIGDVFAVSFPTSENDKRWPSTAQVCRPQQRQFSALEFPRC